MLKQQTINIHNCDNILFYWGQYNAKILHLAYTENENILQLEEMTKQLKGYTEVNNLSKRSHLWLGLVKLWWVDLL